MNKPLPRDLPCFTTADEQRDIVNGAVAAGLAKILRMPQVGPDDPKLLENMKLWETQGRDAWLCKELDRLESMDWSKK